MGHESHKWVDKCLWYYGSHAGESAVGEVTTFRSHSQDWIRQQSFLEQK